MNLQPDDFWSFNEWLLRPGAFAESALLKGIAMVVLFLVLGGIVAYLISSARYGSGEGFYAVARAVRDFFRVDLPGTRPRRIIALARLAFKEALRRKVLYIVGLFVVVLLLAGWYLNPESEDPARLYISFVLTTTNYLILALALFISAFSLPEDIKNKTIYTIVTKPVKSTEVILGRMLGFIAVGTMILVPMGVLSYVFVTRGLDHTHNEVVEVTQQSDGSLVGRTDFVRNHDHAFTIYPEDADSESGVAEGLTQRVREHEHIVRRNADGTFSIGDVRGALKARVPSYGDLAFRDRSGNYQEAGIDVGNEQLAGGYGSAGVARLVGLTAGARKIQHGYVEGGTLGAAEFTFDDVTRERYPAGIPLDLSVRAYRSFKGDIETGIRGSLTLQNPTTQVQSQPIAFIVDEYTIAEMTLPTEIESGDGGEVRMLDVHEDLVDENNELTIILKCIDSSQYLGVTPASIYLRPANSSFVWNLTKSYLSIWLQMTMVIAFGVMFSTFLSGPVAMIASAATVFLGFSAEEVYDTRHYMDVGINRGGGPIESMVRMLRQDAQTTELDVDTLAASIIKGTDTAIVYLLDAVVTALPNLPKMVATAEYAASGFDIFGALLARHAVATAGYVLIAFLISYFALKSREIAA